MANPSAPPNDQAGGDRAGADDVETLAARLGIALPAECVAGVRHHTRLLDRHWLDLRAFALPEG